MVLLKHLSNFCRTLKMPLINCEINILLTWSSKCIIVTGNVENQGPKFAITAMFQLRLYQLKIMENYCN